MKPDLLERLDAWAANDIDYEAAAAIRELQGEVTSLQINAESDQIEYTHQITTLLKQLAEREAMIQKMRELLVLAKIQSARKGTSEIIEQALSLPSPTEHLSQYRDAVLHEASEKLFLDAELCLSDRMYIANLLKGMKEKK